MKKYKLILSIDNEPIESLCSGSLQDIDNYILNNNINNSNELYNFINKNGQYSERTGTYKFEIFSLGKPVEKIDLLYTNDIKIFKRKLNNFIELESEIFKKITENLKFNDEFLKKFVNPLTNEPDKYIDGKLVVNVGRIKAWELINFQKQYRDFVGLESSFEFTLKEAISDHSVVTKKIEFDKEKCGYDINYEKYFRSFCHYIMGINQNKKANKMKAQYDETRNLFMFLTFFNKEKSVNIINVMPQVQNNSTKNLY